MSFVKALYGTIVSSDFTIAEGKVGFTESDHLYSEMETKGLVKLFPNKAEAEAYEFKSSMELFHESFKSLNPPEGEAIPAPTLDFKESTPVVTDGKPSNIISKPEAKTPAVEVKTPAVETKTEASADKK